MKFSRLVYWLPLVAGVAAWGICGLHAQMIGTVKGFKVADHYDPPNESQVKTLLEAATARPLEGGRYLLTQTRLESFRKTGELELLVNTPECTYDSAHKVADSPGALSMQSGDGKFTLAGQGFLWQQTNSSLFVSNQVHTVVAPEVIAQDADVRAQGGVSRNGPVEIRADAFEYNADTGMGAYRGHVQVSGTNLNNTSLGLSSSLLTLKMPSQERQLEQVTAEREVVLDYGDMHATGDRAEYDVAQALVHVTGHPAWQSQGRQGRGDDFVIDRNSRIVKANGNAWLQLPAQSLGTNRFLGAGSKPAPASAARGERTLEISCTNYEIRTNSATFDHHVRVVQKSGDSPQGHLTCETMNVTFGGTNDLQRLVAQTNVVIESGDRQFTSSKAVYTRTNSLLELTGDPAWRTGLREGSADVLRIDLQQDEMVAEGNASMRLPAEQLGSALPARSGDAASAATPEPTGSTTALPPAASQFAEIYSEDYTLRHDHASFRGGVYITHPRMMWSCQTVDVELPPEGGLGHQITALRSVFFELVDQNGQKVQGRGEQAVYTFSVEGNKTNDWMQLTGDPIIETTNGTFRNRIILFDRAQNKLMAPGRYAIRGSGGVPGKSFKMPENRWLKSKHSHDPAQK